MAARLMGKATPGQILVRRRVAEEAKLGFQSVSYTHLRAHETVLDLVCRLLLENKNNENTTHINTTQS